MMWVEISWANVSSDHVAPTPVPKSVYNFDGHESCADVSTDVVSDASVLLYPANHCSLQKLARHRIMDALQNHTLGSVLICGRV